MNLDDARTALLRTLRRRQTQRTRDRLREIGRTVSATPRSMTATMLRMVAAGVLYNFMQERERGVPTTRERAAEAFQAIVLLAGADELDELALAEYLRVN